MKVAQRAGTHIVPASRSNWLPFYRPYSFASQPFDCFAENIQFSRSCTAVQPPFLRLADCIFILSCLSSRVKILRPVFSVFCRSFYASRLLLFCSGPFSAAPPSPPKKHPARRCLREVSQREEISGNYQCFTQKTPPLTQKALKFYPPPRAILSLANDHCFLVSSPMLWYELEGTVAYRPVRFQYIIE